jgi:uncharacterized protein
MKLIDSCVWAEILAESETGKTFRERLPQAKELLVSTLVLFEVSKWASRTMSSQKADEVLVTLLTGQVAEPTTAIALLAAELSRKHKLHALDALIYATALEHDAELVTIDAHFKDLPQVDYIPKVNATL